VPVPQSRPRPDELVRLVGVLEEPLDATSVHDALADDRAGGVTVFVGAVRDHDSGRGVTALSYSAHPTARQRLRDVCVAAAERHDVLGVAAVHRVGDLQVGDLAVVVGACAAHREEAFAACRWLIDELKATVPIWKHQRFSDGGSQWVGTP
jgi:molybdopterin synthase catalytic subunit